MIASSAQANMVVEDPTVTNPNLVLERLSREVINLNALILYGRVASELDVRVPTGRQFAVALWKLPRVLQIAAASAGNGTHRVTPFEMPYDPAGLGHLRLEPASRLVGTGGRNR
ncbi:hypothetical protein PSPO01_09738 [Paraphaeosphaeria sporulosa]